MEQKDLFVDNKERLLLGFRPGGIGMHGTFRGYIPEIQRRGLLLPSARGLPNVKDNVVAYYTTPSQNLIEQTVKAVGEEYAAELLLGALLRQLRSNVGYAQSEGFGDVRKQLDWSNWQKTPDLLPAVIFFKNAGEVQPVGSPDELAAKGSFPGKLTFPGVHSLQSIDAELILDYVELTPEDVEYIENASTEISPDFVIYPVLNN